MAVKREDYLPLVRFLKEDPALKLDFLIELTAVDWKDRFDVVVHLLSIEHGHKLFLRCALPARGASGDRVPDRHLPGRRLGMSGKPTTSSASASRAIRTCGASSWRTISPGIPCARTSRIPPAS